MRINLEPRNEQKYQSFLREIMKLVRKEILFFAFNKIKTIIGFTGLPLAVSLFTGYKKVTILCYHNPTPSFFAGHVSWLIRHFNVIPFKRFFKAIYQKDPSILPPRSLVVTIDDGWQQNADLIPVLLKFKFPILIYLTAGMIGRSRKFWWSVVKEAGGDVTRLKQLPSNEFFKVLRNQYDYQPEKEYPVRCVLNWDEVYSLKRTGLVEFGSHSLTHPILTNCSDDMAWKEIIESKRIIEDHLYTVH